MGVYKKGDKWFIDYYVEGKRKRKMIGPSKELAKLALKDVQVKIAKGEYLGIYETKKVLFKDFADEYLMYCLTNHSPISSYQEKKTFEHTLIPAFGDKYLFNISPQLVEDYKAARQAMGKRPATINKELRFLKAALNRAVEWGYLKESPIASVKKLKEALPRPRFLSLEEMEKLLVAASGSYIYPILIVALNTGMRKGELLNLEWKDIDFANRIITVDNKVDHHVKNYRPRSIPMNQEVYETLRVIKQHSNYVFCHKDGAKYKQPYRAFNKAKEIAGVKNFRFHDLRHTFASHLVMNGYGLKSVKELLGHSDIKMAERYSHLSPEHLQKAVENVYYGHYLDTNEGVKNQKPANSYYQRVSKPRDIGR